MTILDRPVRIPRPAFFIAWDHAEGGKLPAVVAPDDAYATTDFSRELEQRTMSRFEALRLATPDGRLTPQFRATLELLAAPERELYAWTALVNRPEDNGAVLVASAGRDAVRLITDHRSIQLDPIPAHELAASLADTLPNYPPARIGHLRMPMTYLDGRTADPLSEASGHADQIRHLSRAERAGVHKLYAAVRSTGDRIRSTPRSPSTTSPGPAASSRSPAPTTTAAKKSPCGPAAVPPSSMPSPSPSTDSPEDLGSQQILNRPPVTFCGLRPALSRSHGRWASLARPQICSRPSRSAPPSAAAGRT
ncbi:ESAT-6 protein secretion system EspG family protein [Amycolatopsis sulphurea]|uniref:ESAT-6 protein secretion system EspG family protein n=1 Tax=Amycolatopsis sulphurea TaxID=76022 RepID=A0A2A9FD64_9PSEU|nr:ESX secretion-associated protein EspG [Amycolatopsis sulphurea]PFG48691.1 ESAT-6 protein secretion system EspG family protein [Amycolatopsis sulphurea]